MANARPNLDDISTDLSLHFEEMLYLSDETDENCTSENISLSVTEFNVDKRGKESFRQTNITITSLRAVLNRLAEPEFNFIKEEQTTAAAVLKLLNLGESHVHKFEKLLDSVASFFERCFVTVKSPKKQVNVRASELEKNFMVERFNSVIVNTSWNNILTTADLSKNSSTENVLQHILQHFWSTVGSTFQKINIETDYSNAEPDSMELSAISYHAGWAIKRARDIIKHASDEQLKILQATNMKDFHQIDKSRALEVISKLGEDVKQSDGLYKFIPTTCTLHFFIFLHDRVDSLLSKSHLYTEGIIKII